MELKQNLKDTMTQKYMKEGEEGVTSAVDKLQQEVWLGNGEFQRAEEASNKNSMDKGICHN